VVERWQGGLRGFSEIKVRVEQCKPASSEETRREKKTQVKGWGAKKKRAKPVGGLGRNTNGWNFYDGPDPKREIE